MGLADKTTRFNCGITETNFFGKWIIKMSAVTTSSVSASLDKFVDWGMSMSNVKMQIVKSLFVREDILETENSSLTLGNVNLERIASTNT